MFITDVYTRKIVGYSVSDHMRATANVKALRMALSQHKAPEIHHSDRGSQYTYQAYTDLLKQSGCRLSMALTAQDNAYAERIHRTIKEEYLAYWQPQTLQKLKYCVTKAVYQYNNQWPHNSLKKLSPREFIQDCSLLASQQRTILTIFNEYY
jgi:transposase InsO family protein